MRERCQKKEVLKMKFFVTKKDDKIIKTDKFEIKKITKKLKERIFDIQL